MRISLFLVLFGCVWSVNAAPFKEDFELEGERQQDLETLSAYRNKNVNRYSLEEGRSYGKGKGKRTYYGEGEDEVEGMRRSYVEGIILILNILFLSELFICCIFKCCLR